VTPALRSRLRAALKALVPAPWWAALRQHCYRRLRRRADRRENRRVSRADAPLLVVSESERAAHAYDHWLAWLETARPSLRGAIRLDRVPGATARHARVLHAWVQDPVRERDARLFDALEALEASLRQRGGRILNPAAVLSHSLRDVMMERLATVGMGIRLPVVTRLPLDPDERFTPSVYPVIVRPQWGHGVPMEVLADPEAWRAWRLDPRRDRQPQVLTAFIDVRSPDGLYRKYRYVSFGAQGLPRHLIVSTNWEVRPKDRVVTAATRQEELAFVHGETPYADVLERARVALGFDIAAFDFSYDAQGALVLWEANPYPDLSPPRGAAAGYLEPVVMATYAALADYYEQSLASAVIAAPTCHGCAGSGQALP